MADNTTFQTTVATPPSGLVVAAREATFGGDTAVAQVVTLTAVTGSEGSYTVREVFYADDAAFTPATGGVLATGMLFDDTGPDSVDEGDIGIGRMSARREAYVQIRDAAGNERGLNVDASGNITVNVTGTVTVGSHAVTNAGTFAVQAAQSGTWTVDLGATDNAVLDNIDADLTTIIGHVDGVEGLLTTIDGDTGNIVTAVQLLDDIVLAEDAAHQTGDKGVMALAVRQDVQADFGADGDYVPLSINADGELRVNVSGITVSGATEYTEAATDASFTGPIVMMEGAADAAVPLQGTAADGLLVNLGSNNDVVATNAGTFAVQVDGSALTALQLIDDVVYVDDADWTDSTSKHALVGGLYQSTPQTVTDGDVAPFNITANGALHVAVQNTLTVASHAVTNAGTFAVQVDGAALTALQVIDNPVLVDDAAFTPATSSVMMAGFQADESSTDSVDEGDAGAVRMTLDRKLITTPQPHTAGGLTIFRSIDIDESEEEVKASAGQLYSIAAFNRTAAPLYLKFYNATAANVTVGTTTPVLTFVVPANADSDGAGFVLEKQYGWAFDTAITVACTTGVADNDTGAPGANDCVIDLGYK